MEFNKYILRRSKNEQRINSDQPGPGSHRAIFPGHKDRYLIYTSEIPLDKEGRLIGEDIAEQTTQCLINAGKILEAAGSSLGKVVKTTVFLDDMENFTAMNQVYASFFNAPYPARSCVEVSRLPKGVKVEIEMIASI